jgi:hypothetical protein
MPSERGLTVPDATTSGRIRPSRFVAGIALHLAIPAYLLWLAIGLFPYLTAPAPDRDDLAAAAGRTSVQFLVLYAVLIVALMLATRALEPSLRQARERRESRDPRAAAGQSRARLAAAIGSAASLGDGRALHSAIERLGSAPWRHDDPRFQTLTADLAKANGAFVRARGAAGQQGGDELQDLAASTFDRIAAAAEHLAEEQSRLDHGDARTLARYIELRYPSSDFDSVQNS